MSWSESRREEMFDFLWFKLQPALISSMCSINKRWNLGEIKLNPVRDPLVIVLYRHFVFDPKSKYK